MLSLANAIQILAGEKKVTKVCGECKRDIVEKSDSKQFKEFLDNHANISIEYQKWRKKR